ncbi:hypothetical protein BTO06_16545 [Tenacibaculum sp. SZ-18]|uniref:GNAT family N-acetyltransferase n=1 Tax=Tenacibaculum sp. SZ-18 TaxID=754423 RepID=UPI000C2D670F|nr:GNAT family N-acetyltransferase [Tenacibaculum sp. SZ-18]AUC16657.1 hypothetical protein BTO06_16545 [Tenacibaculum sp. SZ-18]
MIDQNIKIKTIHGAPSKEVLDDLLMLYTLVFEDAIVDFFMERISTKEDVVSIIAYKNEVPVGFKIGYRYNESTFYSWVGGVLLNHRKKGIAKKLAASQESIAKEKRFTRLRTKSMNRFKPMLILNLKNGFDIVQVYINEKGQQKIVFEKEI